MQIIYNVFSEEEINFILKDLINYHWIFGQSSSTENDIKFWVKLLIDSKIKELFKYKIESSIKHTIKINSFIANGQSFGQCGYWHTDKKIAENNLTFIYFYQKWKPEFGGHFMINIDGKIISELPEYNKGILFDCNHQHMGLSPSRHCNIQRENIVCQFQILNV